MAEMPAAERRASLAEPLALSSVTTENERFAASARRLGATAQGSPAVRKGGPAKKPASPGIKKKAAKNTRSR